MGNERRKKDCQVEMQGRLGFVGEKGYKIVSRRNPGQRKPGESRAAGGVANGGTKSDQEAAKKCKGGTGRDV